MMLGASTESEEGYKVMVNDNKNLSDVKFNETRFRSIIEPE
jgi:hypothetical protein